MIVHSESTANPHRWIRCAAAVYFSLIGWIASAHKPSDSYLRIRGGDATLTIEWDIALMDLEIVVGLDADQDGEVTWGELRSRGREVAAYAIGRLQIDGDGNPADLVADDLLFNRHSDGGYAVLLIQTDCPGDVQEITLHYNLLFDIDPTHRGLVLYNNGSIESTHVIGPDQPRLTFATGEVGYWRAFIGYVREGIWHIWIGYDHILFLLTLLLPSVLVRKGRGRRRRWSPVTTFWPVLWNVLRMVTAFTLAHSITLWLAVMGWVTLPSRFVEASIAFSIILTAANNLYPFMKSHGWEIAFGFGLVHGFGFAGVLQDLGLSNSTLLVSLLGFNLGVETGQAAIVAAFLPIGYHMRKMPMYGQYMLRGGSIVILLLALMWFVERAFGIELIGF